MTRPRRELPPRQVERWLSEDMAALRKLVTAAGCVPFVEDDGVFVGAQHLLGDLEHVVAAAQRERLEQRQQEREQEHEGDSINST